MRWYTCTLILNGISMYKTKLLLMDLIYARVVGWAIFVTIPILIIIQVVSPKKWARIQQFSGNSVTNGLYCRARRHCIGLSHSALFLVFKLCTPTALCCPLNHFVDAETSWFLINTRGAMFTVPTIMKTVSSDWKRNCVIW